MLQTVTTLSDTYYLCLLVSTCAPNTMFAEGSSPPPQETDALPIVLIKAPVNSNGSQPQGRKRKRAPATPSSPAPSDPGSNAGGTSTEFVRPLSCCKLMKANLHRFRQSSCVACRSFLQSYLDYLSRARFHSHCRRFRMVQNRRNRG